MKFDLEEVREINRIVSKAVLSDNEDLGNSITYLQQSVDMLNYIVSLLWDRSNGETLKRVYSDSDEAVALSCCQEWHRIGRTVCGDNHSHSVAWFVKKNVLPAGSVYRG